MSERFNPAEVGETIEEREEPVRNLIESFDKLYYAKGSVTHRSRFARGPEDNEGRERPLFARLQRAEAYKEFTSLPKGSKEERKEILEEARIRDSIHEQLMDQKEIAVTLPDYGEQKARTVSIEPPESRQTPETKALPPIFLVPGISNDIECMSSFIAELAFQGRRVVAVGYPESFMGSTTQGFADAVQRDPGFGPHIQFYKAALDALFRKEEPIELWGYSTGAPIVSGILKDEKFQSRASNAAFLFPAASVDQGLNSLKLGVAHELGSLWDSSSAALNLTVASKGPREKEQGKLRTEIMASLMKKISGADQDWRDARVKQGGNIFVVSGEKDEITKSAGMKDEFEAGNSQVRSMNIPDAYHSMPQLQPDELVSEISKLERQFRQS